MTATSVISNTAGRGGGVLGARDVDIVNSLFARNSATVGGAAVYMFGDSPVETRLRHLTIVSPTVGTVYLRAAIMVRGQATALITNTIVGGYDRCYCGRVKQTKEPFPTDTYCHCSTGWYQSLFEAAFDKPVEVTLKQSILQGADRCEFEIRIG